MTSEIQNFVRYPEAELVFHPERTSDRDVHPLRGLARFGPYSRSMLQSPIRVATLAPAGESDKLFSFMKELHGNYKPVERDDYLPDWAGFNTIFDMRVTAAAKACRLELDRRVDHELANSELPHNVLAEHLIRAIQPLEARRHEFDVLFIYLPQRWAHAFQGATDDFDLRDHLKAYTAARGMPIQIVREERALAYRCRASVMWRIGLALYAKAGGIPWKLADVDPETAYIGISYAVRPTTDDRPRFVTCCSQVFDAEGAGLEFIAYDTNDVEVQRDNPFLSQAEMFRVITRSMNIYRRRHGGRTPKRVMIHKSTEFKAHEMRGCFEALQPCEAIDLLQIVEDVGWRGVWWERNNKAPRGTAAAFPVRRGSLVGLGDREALLWMHGAVDDVGSGTYFQGKRSTPRPIKLVRQAGHGTWDDTARAVLALSKMNWNNDGLYDHLPVTMGYAKVLARVLKRMSHLGTAAYQFRFFM